MTALTTKTTITTTNPEKMSYLLPKEWKECLGTHLVDFMCYGFGGVMEAIGALTRISDALLKLFKSVFGLFI